MLLRFHVFSQTNGEKWGEMKIFLLFSFIYYKKKINFAENSLLRPVALEEGCLANGGRKQPWAW